DYMHGVPLRDAASNSTSASLYAYLGPCITPFIVPPTPPTPSDITGWGQYCITYTNVQTIEYQGYVTTNFGYCPIIAGGGLCALLYEELTNQYTYLGPGKNIIT